MKIRVAGFQMEVSTDVKQNVILISRAIRQASSANADILLTPEGALSGYSPEFNPTEVTAALLEVTELAHQQHMGLTLGTCFLEPDGLIYDQLRFYTANGEYLGFHSKILRCGTLTDPSVGEINDYATKDLQVFSFEGIKIGGLICNDMWANPQYTPMPDPHLSQQLSEKGARIIFHAVNGGRDGSNWSREVTWNFHEANLRMRAAAARVWIVTVDSTAPATLPCSAPSGVIDHLGNWVCRTKDQGEQFFVYTIDQ